MVDVGTQEVAIETREVVGGESLLLLLLYMLQ